MKRRLYLGMIGWATVILPDALGSSVGSVGSGGPIHPIALHTANGTEQVFVVHDEASGRLTASTFRNVGSGGPAFATVDVASMGYFDGRFLTAGDLNGDQVDEAILPGYHANQVLVISVQGTTNLQLSLDALPVSPGPLVAASARRPGAFAPMLVVGTTAAPDVTVQGWDVATEQPVTQSATFPPGFAGRSLLGFQIVDVVAPQSTQVLAMLRRDTGDTGFPLLELFSNSPEPAFGPLNSTRVFRSRAGHQILRAGSGRWLLAYAPGSSMVELFPAGAGDSHLQNLGGAVEHAYFLPEINDEVLVVFQQGDIHVYDFVPGSNLSLRQTLSPPSAQSFVAAAGTQGKLLALTMDGSGEVAQFLLFDKDSMGHYQLINQGAWPNTAAERRPVTVVLYTDDPFGTPEPFPSQTFLAGDWATMASFSGGQVQALAETFGGLAEGLGQPMLETFEPTANPGAQARALGNQWEPSSSVFHLDPGPTLHGLAAVKFSPPAGSYPNTIQLGFEAHPLVTVHYRVNEQPWQTGLGPVTIAQDATVQFYGERTFFQPIFSSIQTIDYRIEQPPGNDTDGDLVPDAIEALAGTDPFQADSDGDGEDDFSEILGEGDPNDPASQSSGGAAVASLQRVLIQWEDANSAVFPAMDQEVFINDLDNVRLTPSASRISGDVWVWRPMIEQGIPRSGQVHKVWLPSNFKVAVGNLPEAVGPAVTGFFTLNDVPPPIIPVDLAASDPLAAWRTAAQQVVDTYEPEPIEVSFGPAGMLSGLLFEYWYGLRLLERGLIQAIEDRPRLADTPRSVRLGIAQSADVAAIEEPQSDGANLFSHELAHAVQQASRIPAHTPEWTNARLGDPGRTLLEQAMLANLAGTPLDPPIDVLRRLIDGLPLAPGYVMPPDMQASIVELRDDVLPRFGPLELVTLSGVLSFENGRLLLDAQGMRFQLLDRPGRRYAAPGSGLVTPGSTATVVALLLSEPPPSGIDANLRVFSLSIDAVPAFADTDENDNGVPDTWEWAFLGGLGFDLWDDIDGDLFVVGEEYLAASDPRNDQSRPDGEPATPRNLVLRIQGQGQGTVEWDGSLVASYELWVSDDFSAWHRYPGMVTAQGNGRHSFPVDITGQGAFFKLRIDLPLP